jgi:hypothetical protein
MESRYPLWICLKFPVIADPHALPALKTWRRSMPPNTREDNVAQIMFLFMLYLAIVSITENLFLQARVFATSEGNVDPASGSCFKESKYCKPDKRLAASDGNKIELGPDVRSVVVTQHDRVEES